MNDILVIPMSKTSPAQLHNTLADFFGDPVYSYSRAQALEDGYLVDVSETSREAGVKFPVALTRAAWDAYIVPDERARKFGQDERGRLWDVLTIFKYAAKQHLQGNTMHFGVYFIMKAKQKRFIPLKAVIGPGDDPAPVITIMKPEED